MLSIQTRQSVDFAFCACPRLDFVSYVTPLSILREHFLITPGLGGAVPLRSATERYSLRSRWPLDRICPFPRPAASLRPGPDLKTDCLVLRFVTLGSDFFLRKSVRFSEKRASVWVGEFFEYLRGTKIAPRPELPANECFRLMSLKDGLACHEAMTGPKLMIFAIQRGNANVPILIAIRTEEVPPIGKREQA